MGNVFSTFLRTLGFLQRNESPEIIWQITPRRAPRTLENILGSENLTKDFRNHLANLDLCLKTNIALKYLDFWMACHTLQFLHKIEDMVALKDHLKRMHEEFFTAEDNVFLSSKALHKSCKKICARKRTADLRPLWVAQNEVTEKLLQIHGEFGCM